MTENENTAQYAFRKFGDTVLRTAYACTGSIQEAEDITQDVFLKLHSSQTAFADDEHMKAWLMRAAIIVEEITARASVSAVPLL